MVALGALCLTFGIAIAVANLLGHAASSSAARTKAGNFVSPAPGPPLAGSWHRIFAADFGGNTLDSASWETCYPWFHHAADGCTNFATGELEWYLPSQDQVSGGALHLVAVKKPTTGRDVNGNSITYAWTSGMVTTDHHLDFTYGYVQVVARIPKGDGFWPALWLLPQSQAWPPEIDIMEAYGNNTWQVHFTNHPVGFSQQTLTLDAGQDLSAGYHTYAVNWEPGSITWYLDGQAEFIVTTGVPDQPMYFIANLALNGTPGWVNPDASTPNTASFDIKSVQIWQRV